MLDLNIARKAVNISHPLVCSAYLKKETKTGKSGENVLVLEVNDSGVGGEYGDFDPYLVALLNDLQDLRAQAEYESGILHYIDICRH